MSPATRRQLPTPKELASEDWLVNKVKGRRKCPEHRQQDMIPLGLRDLCPLPHDDPAPQW